MNQIETHDWTKFIIMNLKKIFNIIKFKNIFKIIAHN